MNRHSQYILITRGTQYCPYARGFLSKNNIVFEELDARDPEVATMVRDLCPTVAEYPAVIRDDGVLVLAWKTH